VFHWPYVAQFCSNSLACLRVISSMLRLEVFWLFLSYPGRNRTFLWFFYVFWVLAAKNVPRSDGVKSTFLTVQYGKETGFTVISWTWPWGLGKRDDQKNLSNCSRGKPSTAEWSFSNVRSCRVHKVSNLRDYHQQEIIWWFPISRNQHSIGQLGLQKQVFMWKNYILQLSLN